MPATRTFYIETYGCQMNVADGELASGILAERGFDPVARPEDADVVLLNTCAIRDHAEQRVLGRIGQLQSLRRARPGLKLGVVGCMAQELKGELLARVGGVDFVVGPDGYRELPAMLDDLDTARERRVHTRLLRTEPYAALLPLRKDPFSAWVTIIRGCDKFCTYCIVPYTRGRERSREVADVLHEIRTAARGGAREVTLLGQNVNSYRGLDEDGSVVGLAELLRRVAEVDGVERVRYTTSHPQDFGDDLIAVHASIRRVSPFLHLPVQSGSDDVLRRMNRTYTRAEYLAKVRALRAAVPDIALSTDVITGFPGETEPDFERTLELLEEVRYDSAFLFRFSPRRGTKAAAYGDVVPDDVAQGRLERLIQLQRAHTEAALAATLGSTVQVLVQGPASRGEGSVQGRDDHFRSVVFRGDASLAGTIVPVHVSGSSGKTLLGRARTE
ncbi:MAG: tRNA (N6-isopentenyl adenosine(37)-C2)-methylthiotransferase MiaB, partial [Gemmatimonadetes bacterium]|nr:tRNA (N6-isopentenyl adenosine(37)-C2)-methylthiotransferase MiaB [Gemmatimonadota bacterium]